MNKKEHITQAAKELLATEERGIRYSDLLSRLHVLFPNLKADSGNFRGAIWNLDARFPNEVYKPARGLFRLVRFREATTMSPPPAAAPPPHVVAGPRESDFYEPFAVFLTDELEECTTAVSLGGNRFGGKWALQTCSEYFDHEKATSLSCPSK